MAVKDTVKEALEGKISRLQPTVFIGVGGTGLETLKILKRVNQKFYPKDMPIFEYLSIDTRRNDDILDPLEMDEQLALVDNPLVKNAGDIFNNLEKRFPDIYSWMPPVTKWRKFEDISKIREGANQCRALGRYLFNLASNDIFQKIKTIINQVTNAKTLAMLREYDLTVQTGSGVDIFIIGSTCGGTGSGQFLDLAYLCHYATKNLPEKKIIAALGMPNLFAEVTEGTARVNEANSYAALKELDHYMDNKDYSMAYPFGEVRLSKVAPFDLVYLVDSPNENGINLSSRQEGCDLIASAIFAFTASKTKAAYNEYYVDDKHKLNDKAKNDVGTEFVTHYSTFGVASLKFPSALVAKACALRRSKEICQRILNPLPESDDEVEKKADYFISEFHLKRDTLKEYLHPTIRRPFETWYMNTKNKLAAEDEEKIKAEINNEKSHIETILTFNQKKIIDESKKKFLEKEDNGSKLKERIKSFVRKIANNYTSEGLDFALKTILEIKEDLNDFILDIQKEKKNYINDIERHKKSHTNFMKKLEELIEQSWFKDLFDFDKEEQLAGLSDSSILPLRDKGIKEAATHRSEKILEIYSKVNISLSEIESSLQKTKDRVGLTLTEFKKRYKDSKDIPSKERLQYHVLRQNGIDAIYEEISNGMEGLSLANDLERISQDKPISEWSNEFNSEEEIINYLFNEITYPFFHRKIGDVKTYNIYTELKASGKYDDYVVSNLEAPSSPFIKIDTATLFMGGSRHIFDKNILGVSNKDEIDDTLNKLIPHKTTASTNDPLSVILVQTKHAFPLFSLSLIKSYQEKCRSFRATKENPCYTLKDDIISNFKDITPDAEEATNVYHRAVHAFDLGIMTGFLVRKPKGKFYYYCEIRNDINSGFPVREGTGGGRRKTKEWLMKSENREFLEKLEKKIRSVLVNMDKATFDKFYQDWTIFKNKAFDKSQKQREWQSHHLRPIQDYQVGCKNPKVLEEMKSMKG